MSDITKADLIRQNILLQRQINQLKNELRQRKTMGIFERIRRWVHATR